MEVYGPKRKKSKYMKGKKRGGEAQYGCSLAKKNKLLPKGEGGLRFSGLLKDIASAHNHSRLTQGKGKGNVCELPLCFFHVHIQGKTLTLRFILNSFIYFIS
jgi:hypothetical protein